MAETVRIADEPTMERLTDAAGSYPDSDSAARSSLIGSGMLQFELCGLCLARCLLSPARRRRPVYSRRNDRLHLRQVTTSRAPALSRAAGQLRSK